MAERCDEWSWDRLETLMYAQAAIMHLVQSRGVPIKRFRDTIESEASGYRKHVCEHEPLALDHIANLDVDRLREHWAG